MRPRQAKRSSFRRGENDLNKNPKILLVEDEESVREAIKFTLDKWYDVIAFDKTVTALELLQHEKFDIVLLDIVIRGEGEEGSINALKFIAEKYPGLPVVMLSGSIRWMQRWDELKRIGAAGYLGKPFEQSRAKELIDRCIKGEKMGEVWM